MKRFLKIISVFTVVLLICSFASFSAFAEGEEESVNSGEAIPSTDDSTETDVEQPSEDTTSETPPEDPAPEPEPQSEEAADNDVTSYSSYTGDDNSDDTEVVSRSQTASLSSRRPDSSEVRNSDKYGTMSSEKESKPVQQPKNIGSDYDKLAEILFFVFLGVAFLCVIGLIVFNVIASNRNNNAEDIPESYDGPAPKEKRKKPAHSKDSTKKRYKSNEFKDPGANSAPKGDRRRKH